MTGPVPDSRFRDQLAEECAFCLIAEERAPAKILRRWVDALAIVPLNPVTGGHTLVLPYTHVSDAAMHPVLTGQVMQRAAEIAGLHASANIITSIGAPATQTVFHLHVHVVPRRPGDGLSLPWSPAAAEVEARVQAAANQRAAEVGEAVYRFGRTLAEVNPDALTCDAARLNRIALDAHTDLARALWGPGAAALASPAPAPQTGEGS